MDTDKIVIIHGHPDQESFNGALAEAYKRGATQAGATVQEIPIRDLHFSPNLSHGYRKRTELEPDLIEAQQKIKWADHLVWVYPVWWGSVPAIMEGFIDRVLLPGFAFQKREGSVWWDRYLTGRTARLICTLDQPAWYYRWRYGSPSHRAMRKLTLEFVGIKPVRITTIGPLRLSQENFRTKWLHKVEKLGNKKK